MYTILPIFSDENEHVGSIKATLGFKNEGGSLVAYSGSPPRYLGKVMFLTRDGERAMALEQQSQPESHDGDGSEG